MLLSYNVVGEMKIPINSTSNLKIFQSMSYLFYDSLKKLTCIRFEKITQMSHKNSVMFCFGVDCTKSI